MITSSFSWKGVQASTNIPFLSTQLLLKVLFSQEVNSEENVQTITAPASRSAVSLSVVLEKLLTTVHTFMIVEPI